MSKRLTKEEYILKCRKIHGDRYDYSETKYIDCDTKVRIVCREHGSFQQWPSDHRRGFGCPSCSGKARGTTKNFIFKARKVHGDYYDYTEVEYQSLDRPINIVCPKHGTFTVVPRHHLYGSQIGCAKCSRSKGEVLIKQWLEEEMIPFEEQKGFEGLLRKRFDFFIPHLRLCIEYDGAQHYHVRHQRTRNKENAKARFKALKERDQCKTDFCRINDYRLLRINYRQFKNIPKILKQWIYL